MVRKRAMRYSGLVKTPEIKTKVGNVYKNIATGNKFKVIKLKKRLITLRGAGMTFITTPDLMKKYVYVGKRIGK